MHLTPVQESELKSWIVHRLDDMSDLVDAGILADLAIGLLRSDKRVETLRNEVLKNLDDILEAETDAFVQDLFREAARIQNDNTVEAATTVEASLPESRSDLRKKRKFDHEDCEPFPALPTPPEHSLTSYADTRYWNSNEPQHRSMVEKNQFTNPGNRFEQGGPAKSTQEVRHQNTMFAFTKDPNDPTLPMKVASFRKMKENFPYLTQMWLNNMRLHGHELPDWVVDPNYDYMAADPVPDYTPPVEELRCSDYEATGLCIRGDLCPYTHDGSHSQEQARQRQAAGTSKRKPNKRQGKPRSKKKQRLDHSTDATGHHPPGSWHASPSAAVGTDTRLNPNMHHWHDSESKPELPPSQHKRPYRKRAQNQSKSHDVDQQQQSTQSHEQHSGEVTTSNESRAIHKLKRPRSNDRMGWDRTAVDGNNDMIKRN